MSPPNVPFLRYVMRTDQLNTDASARGTSRKIACLTAALLLVAAGDVPGQRTSADSLLERLRRAEAAIATLQAQIAEQAGSGVQARSRMRLELNGRVLMNAFHNSRRVNNVDNPQFALDAATPGRGGGIAIRQTQLGLVVTSPEVMGGAFTGDVDVDFYGGQMPSNGGRTFPLLRLRTARAVIRWTNTHLLVGQESPLISGVNPVSFAAVGTPAFATAGNLWLWLPQARVGIEGGNTVRLGVQGAILAPTSGDAAAAFETDNDLAERSQRPFVQARASAKWGTDLTREVGCGIHQGWLMPGADRVGSRAVACDLLLPVLEWIDVRGEFFSGQALRGLGGGGIGQNFTPAGPPPAQDPLETKGGWLQLNLQAPRSVRVGAGCGGDHPEPVAARRRNDVCAAYAVIRPGPVFFGAEVRRLRTEYQAGRFTNDHVTLVTGFEF